MALKFWIEHMHYFADHIVVGINWKKENKNSNLKEKRKHCSEGISVIILEILSHQHWELKKTQQSNKLLIKLAYAKEKPMQQEGLFSQLLKRKEYKFK
jgi:hypothetical protein